MPGYKPGENPFHCEECVPRGCSCNWNYIERDEFPKGAEGKDWSWITIDDWQALYSNRESKITPEDLRQKQIWYYLDSQLGKPFPCCEFSYDEDEIEESFKPNWANAPGNTIKDCMTDKNITVTDLAIMLNGNNILDAENMSQEAYEDLQFKSDQYVYDLLKGKIEIDEALALKLEKIFGVDKQFWINRDKNYKAALDRLGKERGWETDKSE